MWLRVLPLCHVKEPLACVTDFSPPTTTHPAPWHHHYPSTEFAREEISELESQLVEAEGRLKLLLLPKDPLDERDVMLEIR